MPVALSSISSAGQFRQARRVEVDDEATAGEQKVALRGDDSVALNQPVLVESASAVRVLYAAMLYFRVDAVACILRVLR